MQVVADLAVVAGQRADERGAVAAAPEGERGELEPGGPALRPLLQPVHVGRFEAELERAVEQLVGLGVGELQLLHADLHELAGRPETCERQRRVGAAGDRDPQRPRQVAHEVRDRGVQELVTEQVIVVEHEHDRRLQQRQLVDQPRQHDFDHARTGVGQRGQHRASEARHHGPDRGDDVAPEADRVVVAGVERDPGERRLRMRGVPLREQHGLAPTGRRAYERQPAVRVGEPRDERIARDEPRPDVGNVDLGGDEDEPGEVAGAAAAFRLTPSCARGS